MTGPQKRRFTASITAPRLFAGSFLLLILAGTAALSSLPGLYTGDRLSRLDALFTATSAVCVTGLTVSDTATAFTPAGQAVILLLIQLGGLGIITFSTAIILALGKRISLGVEEAAGASTGAAFRIDYRRLTRNVVLSTAVLETAGALVLYALWRGRTDGSPAWHALFQSVSAFCNAGFSTFSDSLSSFRTEPAALGTIMFLIVIGGIGFPVLSEIFLERRRTAGRAGRTLSLHARIVLVTTTLLLLVGGAMYSRFEWNVAFSSLSAPEKLVNGLFMSVTARTAGFNTIDYADASDSSVFLTTILMFIGGSPGSTAGGVKTTTVAILLLIALSRLRGRGITSVSGRSVPEETNQRAVGLCVAAFIILAAAVFVFTASEIGFVSHRESAGSFVKYLFEATSAFNTVGLSLGVTGDLSPVGRGLVIFLMFLGRVGPLTFASAIALRRPTARYEFRYSYEDVIIG